MNRRRFLYGRTKSTAIEVFHQHRGLSQGAIPEGSTTTYFRVQVRAKANVPLTGTIKWGDSDASGNLLNTETAINIAAAASPATVNYDFSYPSTWDRAANVTKTISIQFDNGSNVSILGFPLRQLITAFGDSGYDLLGVNSFSLRDQQLIKPPLQPAGILAYEADRNDMTYLAQWEAMLYCKGTVTSFRPGSGRFDASFNRGQNRMGNVTGQVYDMRGFNAMTTMSINNCGVAGLMLDSSNAPLTTAHLWGNDLHDLAELNKLPNLQFLWAGGQSTDLSMRAGNPLTVAFNPATNLALRESRFFDCFAGHKAAMLQTIANYHAVRTLFVFAGTKILNFGGYNPAISQSGDPVTWQHIADLQAAGFSVTFNQTA